MLVTGPTRQIAALSVLLLLAASGCSPFRNATPAECVRPNFNDAPRGSREPINFTRLEQVPPAVYLLAPRDILGIFIGGVLGEPDKSPPVHFSDMPDLPPAMGFPVPVREDGTLSLPLIPPITVTGLTIAQAEHEIREAYTVISKILPADRAQIVVTLMRPRTYSVLVVREDSSTAGGEYGMGGYGGGQNSGRGGVGFEPQRHAATRRIELRAYENDVLHALTEAGGLPGIDAKNEVTVLRNSGRHGQLQNQLPQAINDPATRAQLFASGAAIKIPLRTSPCDPPLRLTQDDITLNTGDILFVESRSAEVFYTGGLLQGHQIPLPRDYDLDVLGAIAMAGGQIAAGAGSNQAGVNRGGVGSLIPPSRVVVIRSVEGQMRSIRISMKNAILDPKQRLLVLPNDLIILEYTDFELAMNVLLNNVSLNLSLNQLFQR